MPDCSPSLSVSQRDQWWQMFFFSDTGVVMFAEVLMENPEALHIIKLKEVTYLNYISYFTDSGK